MTPLNIVMIGPKGAGKTSILSVMLHDVQQFVERMAAANPVFADLSVHPSLEAVGMAHETLNNGYGQLKNLAVSARESSQSVDMSAGKILGDQTSRCTPVLFRMGRHEMLLNFWDFPGGFYSQDFLDRNAERGYSLFSREEIAQWEDIVRSADVILLAVDASMQLGEKPLLKDNSYYTRITSLVKDSIGRSMTSLVFVPVKCEHMALAPSYDDALDQIALPFDKNGCARLRTEVEQLFPELVRFVRDPDIWGNVDAFFAPMITVGGIRCSGRSFDPAAGKATIRFAPVVPAHSDITPFKPMNCDKIFALCLLRTYRALVEEWKENRTLWERVTSFFRNTTPFEKFFDQLAESIGFLKLFGTYFAEHPEFLASQGHGNLQDFYAKLAGMGPEDGCATLNMVYFPTLAP